MDHDQNFKNLILDYPREALAFFAAEEAEGIEGARVVPVRQEQLKERLGERFRELDVPLLVEWPDGGGEEAFVGFAACFVDEGILGDVVFGIEVTHVDFAGEGKAPGGAVEGDAPEFELGFGDLADGGWFGGGGGSIGGRFVLGGQGSNGDGDGGADECAEAGWSDREGHCCMKR